MILAAKRINGKKKYYNSKNGKEVHPGRLPDYALRFISPQGGFIDPKNYVPDSQRQEQRKAEGLIKINDKQNWFVRFVSWLKSLFNGRK